ncbi:hypothetical protein ABH944_006203 [Caballeronia udeis]|uniref:Uncharacterized protein n=1 Tax=Caballeronia udeis TaxID=1232866 RepID=A0ABW8MS15_9BURK
MQNGRTTVSITAAPAIITVIPLRALIFSTCPLLFSELLHVYDISINFIIQQYYHLIDFVE